MLFAEAQTKSTGLKCDGTWSNDCSKIAIEVLWFSLKCVLQMWQAFLLFLSTSLVFQALTNELNGGKEFIVCVIFWKNEHDHCASIVTHIIFFCVVVHLSYYLRSFFLSSFLIVLIQMEIYTLDHKNSLEIFASIEKRGYYMYIHEERKKKNTNNFVSLMFKMMIKVTEICVVLLLILKAIFIRLSSSRQILENCFYLWITLLVQAFHKNKKNFPKQKSKRKMKEKNKNRNK